MNNFISDDSYHDGYQARMKGLTLSDWPRGLSKDHLAQWRTGWNDADHDIIYIQQRNEMKRLKRPSNIVRARKDAKFLKRVTFYALLEGFSESFTEGYSKDDENVKVIFDKLISLCRMAQAKAQGNITDQDTRAIHRAMVRFSDECITGSTYTAVFAFFLNYSDDLISEVNNPNTVYKMIHKTLLSVSDYIEGAYKEHYKCTDEFFLNEFGKGNEIMNTFTGIFESRDSFYAYGKNIVIDEKAYAELMTA